MIKKIGYCENFGQCDYADNKTPIEFENGDPICPRCQTELEGEKLIPWKTIIGLGLILLIVIGVAAGAYRYDYFNFESEKPVTQAANASPSPSPSPEPVAQSNALCKGDLHTGVLDEIMERGSLIMGVEFDALPINSSPVYEEASDEEYEAYTPQKDESPDEMKRRKGELDRSRTGFDYEVSKMIAAQMGLKGNRAVKTREVGSFGELFCLLNRKEPDGKFSVDIIMSGIVPDNRYDDTIRWSKSYATFYYAMIAKKSATFSKLADLKNGTIGIIENDASVEAYVKKELPEAKIVKYDDSDWGWTDCAINNHKCSEKNNGREKVDACIYDYPFAKQEMENVEPLKGQALEILDAKLPNSIRDYHIGVAKGNDELLEKINDAIKYIKDDPSAQAKYASLVRKYMTPPEGSIKKPEIEEGEIEYRVKPGETLSKIAEKFLGDANRWPEIFNRNNYGHPDIIKPGQIYYIKGANPAALEKKSNNMDDDTDEESNRNSNKNPKIKKDGNR